MYFDAAPHLPPTLPLLQVWASLALGRWDDALMNWPWWQFAFALTLSTYAALRTLTVAPLAALVAAFLVASLPLANVHVAFAGHADLPLAACYACAVLSFLRWAAMRNRTEAVTAVVLAVACTQITAPGAGWAATLLPGVIVVLLPRHGTKIAAAMIAALLFGLLVLAQTGPRYSGTGFATTPHGARLAKATSCSRRGTCCGRGLSGPRCSHGATSSGRRSSR
jgi:hypothetical protein